MKNNYSENHESIFNTHYIEALRTYPDHRTIVLKRLLKNKLLKKNWITLLKHEKNFLSRNALQYQENISIARIQIKKASLQGEDDPIPDIINRTFPESVAIQLLMEYSLCAYDEAIYRFHHSTPKSQPPIKGLKELHRTVEYSYEIEKLLSTLSVSELSESNIFQALWESNSSGINKTGVEKFNDIKNFFSEYAKATNQIINILQQVTGHIPVPIPMSSNKKIYPTRGRDYFIKLLSIIMYTLFDKPNDRIVAEIANSIFIINSASEDTVTKLRLSAQ